MSLDIGLYYPEPNDEDNEIFTVNITHNLNQMAYEAGIYKCMWRPDENGITKAKQLIEPLYLGLCILRLHPERFRQFNPKNGWGNYSTLKKVVEELLEACKRNPEANIWVSR